jgi:hypothetical protein
LPGILIQKTEARPNVRKSSLATHQRRRISRMRVDTTIFGLPVANIRSSFDSLKGNIFSNQEAGLLSNENKNNLLIQSSGDDWLLLCKVSGRLLTLPSQAHIKMGMTLP